MTNHAPGWHFLQLPGPSNVPGRVLRALSAPTIDHRGPAFADLTRELLEGLRPLFGTGDEVMIYPASGTGGWEAALANTLSPGDRVLIAETGVFAAGWADVARRFGLSVDILETDWRGGADAGAIGERLAADRDRAIRAVAVVHNETSTGAVTRVDRVRAALDAADHPALLLVDAISALGSLPCRHDAWRVDVTVAASQKGLMLPPGLAFLAISDKAREAARAARLPRSYWDWERMRAFNADGYFPYTPATNLLFGLREALVMLREEGLEHVFRRHARHAEATRRAVAAWGLETQCVRSTEHSPVLTAVLMPEGHDADRARALMLDRFQLSLGAGLGRLKGRVFRIGHVGDLNDLMVLATLAGVESGLSLAGVPIRRGGVDAAMRFLEQN